MNRDRGRRTSRSFELNGNQEAKYWLKHNLREERRSITSSHSSSALTVAGPNATSRSLWTSERCVAKALPRGFPKTVKSIEQPLASVTMWKQAKRDLKFK
mmetsp:Transcript_37431/g.98157  ORF Transcript_37431/g.98157 Transcript_37431/m.98157 type:complete len:100 (-) Transcript_37431:128-427(-)